MVFYANALTPKVDLQPRWIRILDVLRTDTATRVDIRLQHLPGYWAGLRSGAYLIAEGDSTKKYRIVGTENIELDRQITMPESGHHDGVLYFEKIPDCVKVVNLVENDPSDFKNNVLGIHLDEPETRLHPKTLTLADIMDNSQKPSGEWTGLDPSRYGDLNFYDISGKIHIRGNLTDYSPRCGFSTVSIMTYDDITGMKYPHMAKIASDGSFSLDVNVCYPQFTALDFGDSKQNMFLIPDGLQRQYLFLNPGDTISLSTCVSTRSDREKGSVPEYFGFEGKPNESSVVSMLADSLINQRYGLNSLYYRHFVEFTALMERETIETTEDLCLLLDSVLADLPVLLKDISISDYAKDILSAYAVGQIELLMEEFEMHLRAERGPQILRREDGSTMFVPGRNYDVKAITAPKLRHKELLFDNPLLLCLSGILIDRWENNRLLNTAKYAGRGIIESSEIGKFNGTNNFSEPFDVLYDRLGSTGVGNCFAAQLVQSKSFIEGLHVSVGPISFELDRNSRLLPFVLNFNTSEALNSIVMKEYNDFVKEASASETTMNDNTERTVVIDESKAGDILEKIIAPYRGNVLFLDFWGIGCAPCRAGMIRQQPVLEELADKPFRTLYIASLEDGLDTCKKWLKTQNIKGEHIFITADDWKRLSVRLNFNKIPFGVLIGKDGSILATDYNTLSINDSGLINAMAKSID